MGMQLVGKMLVAFDEHGVARYGPISTFHTDMKDFTNALIWVFIEGLLGQSITLFIPGLNAGFRMQNGDMISIPSRYLALGSSYREILCVKDDRTLHGNCLVLITYVKEGTT